MLGLCPYLDVVLGCGEGDLELLSLLPVVPRLLLHALQLGPQLAQGLLQRRLLRLELPPQLGLGLLPRQQVVGGQLLGSLHGQIGRAHV